MEKTDNNPLNTQYSNEENVSFSDFLLIITRRLKIILAVPTFTCLFAIVYVFFIAKPIYVSTAKIISSSSSGKGSASQAIGIAAQFGIQLPTDNTDDQWVYPEIIKSRILVRKVLKREFFSKNSGMEKKPLIDIINNVGNQNRLNDEKSKILAENDLLSMIHVNEDLRTGIFTIKISARDPKLASNINKVLIEELDMHQREYNKAKTRETREFIEERIVDTEKELQLTEESLKNFMDRNRRIENSPGLQLEQQRLAREVEVLTSVFTTLKQQLETTKIEQVKESSYVIVIDPPVVPIYPEKPKKRIIVIIAGIMGIILGLFISFIQEHIINLSLKEKNKYNEAKILAFKNIAQLFGKN